MKRFFTIILLVLGHYAAYAVTVSYTPQNLNCGTTTITATFSCSFSGNVLVTTMNSGVTIGSSGIMAVTNGVGTISITITTAAPSPVTIRCTVLTTNNASCAAVNDFAQNTITHTCVLPPNDECTSAITLPVNVPSCSTSPYTATNATISSAGMACASFDYRDVWFNFTAINTTVTMNLGTFPGTFLYYALYSSCGGAYSACGIVFANSSTALNSLTVGNSYKIRLMIPSPDAGNVNICLRAASSLPVELSKFEISKSTEDYNEIIWETKSEVNLKEFILQKSVNSVDFEEVAKIAPLQNSSEGSYKFVDFWVTSALKFYYRLKIVDHDEKYEYSNVISGSRQTPISTFTLYPNPAKDWLQLVLPLEFIGQKSKAISIFDTSGRLVFSKDISHRLDQVIPLDIANFEKGNYFIRIQSPAINDSLLWTKN